MRRRGRDWFCYAIVARRKLRGGELCLFRGSWIEKIWTEQSFETRVILIGSRLLHGRKGLLMLEVSVVL